MHTNRIDEDWFGPRPKSTDLAALQDVLSAIGHVTAVALKDEYDRTGCGQRGKGAGEAFRTLVESTLRWRSWTENHLYFETDDAEFKALKFEWVSPLKGAEFDAVQWCHGHSSGILEKVSKPLILGSFPELRAHVPSHLFLLVGTKLHNQQLAINNAAATDQKVRFFLKAMERYLLVPTKLITYGTVDGFELVTKRETPKKYAARTN